MILLLIFQWVVTAQAFTVKRVKGSVEVVRGEQVLEAEKKMNLQMGDVIITKRRARIKVDSDGHQFWIGQNSRFIVEKPESDQQSGAVSLAYGKFRAKVEKDRKKPGYEYKLPTTVAGVRGTEFFAEAQEGGDTLCTLEGVVAATLPSGEVVEVKEGKGLQIRPGQVPRLSDNSPLLVDLWVAQTDFDLEAVQDVYAFQERPKVVDENLSYGAYGWFYYCDASNMDNDSSVSDSNVTCTRIYGSPFIRYGGFYLRPALVYANSNQYGTIEPVPWERAKEKSTAILAEAHYTYETERIQLRIGKQVIEWAGGELLSARRWTPEPMAQTGLLYTHHLDIASIDFLATQGVAEPAVLDGQSQVSLLGFKATLPKHRGELYVLTSDYQNDDSADDPILHKGRESMSVGYFVSNKFDAKWDYRASLISQTHSVLTLADSSEVEASGTYIDLEAGYLLGSNHLSLRYLSASENFVGIHEDWYQLGASGIFEKRINLSQARLKWAHQLNENRSLILEYLATSQNSDTGFVTYRTSAGEMAQELNFIYKEQFGSWNVLGGLWHFQPKNTTPDDASFGFITRLEFHL